MFFFFGVCIRWLKYLNRLYSALYLLVSKFVIVVTPDRGLLDIEVGLHKCSALSPLLFIMVMDVLATWRQMLANTHHGDCYVQMLCAESSVEVEE